jgi:phospholipase C
VLPGLLIILGSVFAPGQISGFQHIVLIVQENRTPDNLFQGLCLPPYGAASACGTEADQFDLQGYGFYGEGKRIALAPVPLGNEFDPVHAHSAFEEMCNPNETTRYPCTQNTRLPISGCPSNCSFEYVDPTASPTIYPYLYLAQNFGWANRMFQTNQGPSSPAHQFLFGGTSAPSAADDAAATFIAENPSGMGCLAGLNSVYYVIDPAHAPDEFKLINNPLGTTCFSRDTMATLLENSKHTWRYYAVGTTKTDISDNIWMAPNWIQEICQPNSKFTKCTGADWVDNVDLNPADVLTDLAKCNLRNMIWVIPTGVNSDHPDGGLGGPNDGGPAWVANVINAVANSPCKDTINGTAVPYWEDTAIVVTWDDWGGFYDHVLPPFLSQPSLGQGDYQLGFRVPLLFISAYTRHTIDSTNQYDFGSILRFAEFNFGIAEGALGFADARSTTNLTNFYSFKRAPLKFQVPTSVPAEFFLNDPRPLTPPDDD